MKEARPTKKKITCSCLFMEAKQTNKTHGRRKQNNGLREEEWQEKKGMAKYLTADDKNEITQVELILVFYSKA